MIDSNGAASDFALLGHPSGRDHLNDLILHSRPDFGHERLKKHQATLAKFFEWAPSYASPTAISIERSSGRPLVGRLIVCTFLPDVIESPRQMVRAYQKVREGCEVASKLGSKVVGLGGFTSIIGRVRGEELAESFGLRVTSGNALTAASAVAQIEALLPRLGRTLEDQTLAVVGASGDIGRACTLALAPRTRRSILIGRNYARLRALADELGPTVEAYPSTEIADAARGSIVVAATSSPRPLLDESDLGPGTVVCDVGYPKTLSNLPHARPDVLVFAGGLVEMPFALDIAYYTGLPGERIMYGCYAESMVLALAENGVSGAIDEGSVTLERMSEMLALADRFGFRPASPIRGSHPVTDDTLETFLAASRSTMGAR